MPKTTYHNGIRDKHNCRSESKPWSAHAAVVCANHQATATPRVEKCLLLGILERTHACMYDQKTMPLATSIA